jgi:hypothetical protein
MKNIPLIIVFFCSAIFIASCGKAPINSATATIDAAIPTRLTNTPNLNSPSPMKTMENNPPAASDQDEAAIYALFMGDPAGKIVIVREDTFTGEPTPQNEEETKKSIQANLPSASSETINNYISVNSVSSKLPSNMNLGVNYVLISTADFLEITGSPNWRDTWRRKYPNSEVSCITFSKIGFDESHTQALVYVARLWVEEGYYLLEHNAENGAWKVVESYSNVIIN